MEMSLEYNVSVIMYLTFIKESIWFELVCQYSLNQSYMSSLENMSKTSLGKWDSSHVALWGFEPRTSCIISK